MTKARDLANASTALSAVSATELGYLDGVTSAVQTQIDAKLASSTAATTYVANSLADAKGDLIAATASDTVARLAVGANGQVLKANSATATGLEWSTVSSGSLTQLATGTLSGSAVNITSISQSYTDLRLDVLGCTFASGVEELRIRVNNLSTTIYRTITTGTSFADPNLTSCETMRNNSTNTESIAQFVIPNYTSARHKQMQCWTYGRGESGGTPIDVAICGYCNIKTTAAINELNLFPDVGNFGGGTYILYGVK